MYICCKIYISLSKDRFEEDFFIDLIFAPVTKTEVGSGSPKSSDAASGSPETVNTALARRERGLVVEPEARDAYDEMLHRDSRFVEHKKMNTHKVVIYMSGCAYV
jgi:hypothetical protein